MHIIRLDNSHTLEVKKLFLKTFSDSEGKAEGELVSSLAQQLMQTTPAQQLQIYGVTDKQRLIACIIFSSLHLSNQAKAVLLSPVAVHSDHQGKGIGQALIKQALAELKAQAVRLVFTYGDINFYGKVGFEFVPQTQVQAPFRLSFPEGWLGLSLTSQAIPTIAGKSQCVEALNQAHYW